MKFSDKSCQHIDACRFCWMCRHICPIGNATGLERNTSRARALALSLVTRDAAPFSDDIVDNVYECALCGACTKDCVTGWDPVMFTKEARLKAALEGSTPEYIGKLLDNIFDIGNVYGEADFNAELKAEIAAAKDSKTLLFLGQDAKYRAPEMALRAIELLKLAGVDFTMMENEPDSGYALDFLISAAEETRSVVLETAKTLSAYDKVVCLDPQDAKIFIREYKEWDAGLTAQVVTFTDYVNELIRSGALKPKKLDVKAVYQDPALLAREVGETESAREALVNCLELSEMLCNRRDTNLGGSTIMAEYMPDVMAKVAARRWHEAEICEVDTLITAAPGEYAVMKSACPEGMKILSFEEAVLNACK